MVEEEVAEGGYHCLSGTGPVWAAPAAPLAAGIIQTALAGRPGDALEAGAALAPVLGAVLGVVLVVVLVLMVAG